MMRASGTAAAVLRVAASAGLGVGVMVLGCGSGDDDDAADPGPFTGTITQLDLDESGCLDPPLELDAALPACRLVEAVSPDAAVTCLSLGREGLDRTGDDALEAELRTRLETQKLCGGDAPPCGDFAFCAILPLPGDAEQAAACAPDPTVTSPLYCACLNLPEEFVAASGYCYLDPTADLGNPAATTCESGPALRFIDSPAVPLPAPSSPLLFEVCDE
jgi:hypothetical protein